MGLTFSQGFWFATVLWLVVAGGGFWVYRRSWLGVKSDLEDAKGQIQRWSTKIK